MRKIDLSRIGYKEWVGVSAAPILWIASIVCFIFGLNFKESTGILIPGTNLDLVVLFSIGLGFAITAIQIVGNDTSNEELGGALVLMWWASYALGVGSNVNFLYGVIGLSQPILQFMVCWGLGIMIEVAPERLLVRFLRSAGVLGQVNKTQATQQTSKSSNQYGVRPPQELFNQQRGQGVTPRPANERRPIQMEPTYHPINNYPAIQTQVEEPEIPEFLMRRMKGK